MKTCYMLQLLFPSKNKRQPHLTAFCLFLNNSDYLPSFSYSVILATFGIERDSGSKVTLKYSFTRHFASSIPVTCAPSVIMLALLLSCAL